MFLDALSSVSQATTAANDRAGIADNFDTFLQLLTTQLQNQNPLDPMDTNQFTQQLVQFSSVEQSIKTNANLESVVQLAAANAATNAVSFIGKNIDVQTAAAKFDGNSATWHYNVDAEASDTTFTIRNTAGSIIYTAQGNASAGEGTLNWNGETLEGGKAAAGTYSLTIEAHNGAGDLIKSSIFTTGTVEAVNFDESEPMLIVNGNEVGLSAVRRVGQ